MMRTWSIIASDFGLFISYSFLFICGVFSTLESWEDPAMWNGDNFRPIKDGDGFDLFSCMMTIRLKLNVHDFIFQITRNTSASMYLVLEISVRNFWKFGPPHPTTQHKLFLLNFQKKKSILGEFGQILLKFRQILFKSWYNIGLNYSNISEICEMVLLPLAQMFKMKLQTLYIRSVPE